MKSRPVKSALHTFRKITPVLVGCFVIVLASCSQSPDPAAATAWHSRLPSTSGTSATAEPQRAARPLDLQVTRKMMDQLVQPDEITDDHKQLLQPLPLLNLRANHNESRIKLKGEVYYDETQENYLQAIDGGRLDIEIKFNG